MLAFLRVEAATRLSPFSLKVAKNPFHRNPRPLRRTTTFSRKINALDGAHERCEVQDAPLLKHDGLGKIMPVLMPRRCSYEFRDPNSFLEGILRNSLLIHINSHSEWKGRVCLKSVSEAREESLKNINVLLAQSLLKVYKHRRFNGFKMAERERERGGALVYGWCGVPVPLLPCSLHNLGAFIGVTTKNSQDCREGISPTSSSVLPASSPKHH